MKVQLDVFIKMVLSAWETQNARISKLLETLTDEELMSETSPGRNRGIYLIGHLTAVSDGMLPILGWGDRLYPELEEIFLTQPDRAVAQLPPLQEIKKYWTRVNETIAGHIKRMTPEEWFTNHTLVSPEDFAKEPHRNKLNIFLNRTNHSSSHYGQLLYLGKRKEE